MEKKSDQNFWNFVFALLYGALFLFLLQEVFLLRGSFPREIPILDLVLIILAVFRLSRLFVYDQILQFFRDFFLKKREIEARDGSILVERSKYKNGPALTVSELLNCPWCISIWVAPLVLFGYFTADWVWYVILALAVSGAATAMQLSANAIGWGAEYCKLRSEHESTEQDVSRRHC